MTGYVSKKLLGAARLPDTPSARAYLDKVLDNDDDDTQVYKKPWVDLTRKQIAEILCDDRWQGRPELMLLKAQAMLKEKNCG